MEIPWDTAKSSLIISNRMRKHFIVQNLNFRKKKKNATTEGSTSSMAE